MRNPVLRIVASLMVVVFPLSMTAADMNAALLHATGGVMLNGAQVPQSTAVFTGDRIETSKDSAVTLTLRGTSVLLSPESAAVYQAEAIELGSGTAVVNTTKGMAARVQRLTVVPAAQGSAKFQVTRAQGQVLIAALRGPVSVSDGSSTKTVSEGTSTTVPDPAPQAGGGGGGLGGLSWTAAIIIGAAAAAAAAAIAVSTSGAPASPSKP